LLLFPVAKHVHLATELSEAQAIDMWQGVELLRMKDAAPTGRNMLLGYARVSKGSRS
jgi:hypothetical protein